MHTDPEVWPKRGHRTSDGVGLPAQPSSRFLPDSQERGIRNAGALGLTLIARSQPCKSLSLLARCNSLPCLQQGAARPASQVLGLGLRPMYYRVVTPSGSNIP